MQRDAPASARTRRQIGTFMRDEPVIASGPTTGFNTTAGARPSCSVLEMHAHEQSTAARARLHTDPFARKAS
jgi:hypothetical protein